MKKLTIKIGVFVGFVVFTGTFHAVASQDNGSSSSAVEKSPVREKIVVEEEQAMAVIPGSTMETEKSEKIKQSSKAIPEEDEKKAEIPPS